MIAVIGAMQVETDAVERRMQGVVRSSLGAIRIAKGVLSGVELVLTRCGVGKVAAATATALVVRAYAPELVLNIGVAGGLGSLKTLDLFLPHAVVEHDMDTSALGDPKGYLSDLGRVSLPLSDRAIRAVEAFGAPFSSGVLASGDTFVSDPQKKEELVRSFDATACDMEGAAIAHACALLGTECAVMRTISDGCDGGEFSAFCERAARECADLLEGIAPLL